MRFLRVAVTPADVSGFTNRTATYSFDRGEEFSITFVHPSAYDDWIADGTDAWYLLGVASAFASGEDYVHSEAIDAELMRNSRSLVRQWHDFYPGRREIRVHAAVENAVERISDEPGLTACFFTAGVDSSFTLSTRMDDVDVLMLANFNFDKADGYKFVEPAQTLFVETTSAFKKRAMVIGTNILWPFDAFADAWSFLTHGAALAAMGHLFAGKINRILISSSHAFGELIPWGSHPLTDPLLASSKLRVEHVGTTYSRFDKVVTLAGFPEALQHLAVCGLPPAEKSGLANCSRCQKCLRTMAALDLCGKIGSDAPSFDWHGYSGTALGRVRLHHPNEYIFFEELSVAAEAGGRFDIADATGTAIRRSRKYKPLVFAENVVRRRFHNVASVKSLKRMKTMFYGVVRG